MVRHNRMQPRQNDNVIVVEDSHQFMKGDNCRYSTLVWIWS